MRFSETLRFNANPDWWVYYIPYDELKLLVSELQELHNEVFFSTASASATPTGTESSTPHVDDSSEEEPDIEAARNKRVQTMTRSASRKVLADMRAHSRAGYGAALKGLQAVPVRPLSEAAVSEADEAVAKRRFEERDADFFEKLDRDANVVDELFKRLCSELKEITTEIQNAAVRLSAKVAALNGDTQNVEDTPLLSSNLPSSPDYAHSREGVEEELQSLRNRIIEHYKEIGETVNFSTLNKTGFDKILKKHDKYTNRNSRAAFMANLLRESQFGDTAELEGLKMRTERIYADLFKDGDTRVGKEDLREGLRDLIIWDRNTIWRDVLRTERKVSAFHSVKGGGNVNLNGLGDIAVQLKMYPAVAAATAFILILCFPGIVKGLQVDGTEYSKEALAAAHRCLALVACVVILWAWEGVPLYVASFIVLPGVVLLRVFLDENHIPLSPQAASKAVFAKMSSPTLLLIVCVYTLGAALSKFEIDKLAATVILSRLRKPGALLCALMFLAVFVSIFVSNVAAPVLLNSVMMPTIDAMGHSEMNRVYVRCLLLGIMVGSNIGGFASPISSPQSAVALGLLTGEHKISFASWLLVALPVCAAMVLTCFLAMYIWYKPQRFALPPLPRFSETLGWRHWVVVATLGVTVLIWSVHDLQDIFGSAGVVAVIPIIVFFGSGILKKEDFNNLPWDVVYLVAGGVVLGAAVESCKLLDLVAGRLTHSLGGNVIWSYAVFCLFMALVANAVSHTVSSIIVLPLIYQIGADLGHPQLLVLGGTFAASSAMALPISSFPNISATQVEDEKGEPYLSTGEVLRVGSVMTALSTVVLLTFGYVIMSWLLD